MNAAAEVVVVMLVFATLAQAWSWLGSYGGVVSFGHGVFFAIGAYAVAVSNLRGGSPWYGALGGALFAVVLAALAGGIFLRGRGLVLSALTLAAGTLAEPFVAARSWVGPSNAFVFPYRPGFLNLQFGSVWPYLLLALAVLAVTQGLTFGLRATRTGAYLRALRSNRRAAGSLGIAARPPQLLVFVVSAFVTSVAGSLFAEFRQSVSPHADAALGLSLDIALAGVVAGRSSPWGAPLAGMALALVTTVVPIHPPGAAGVAALIVEGLAVAAIAVLRPDGLLSAASARGGTASVRSAA